MYFANLFNSEFVGVLVLSDRQYNVNFKVPANINTQQLMTAWVQEPYDLSSTPNLQFNYSYNNGLSYTALVVDVTAGAADVTSVKAFEIVNALNADPTFSALYQAYVTPEKNPAKGSHANQTQGIINWLMIRCLRPLGSWKTYISLTGAETVLRFNLKVGIAELPEYFDRHTIANMADFPDGNGMLVQLAPVDTPPPNYDWVLIEAAGFDPSVVQEDWELIGGRSGLFNFQKITVDGSNRITRIIEYPAGASVADLARQIDYVYTGANTHPSQITEIPHVLASGDLVTPP